MCSRLETALMIVLCYGIAMSNIGQLFMLALKIEKTLNRTVTVHRTKL